MVSLLNLQHLLVFSGRKCGESLLSNVVREGRTREGREKGRKEHRGEMGKSGRKEREREKRCAEEGVPQGVYS